MKIQLQRCFLIIKLALLIPNASYMDMKFDLINIVYASKSANDQGDHHLYIESMCVTFPSRFNAHFQC